MDYAVPMRRAAEFHHRPGDEHETARPALRYLFARCRSALAAEHSPAPVCYLFSAPPQPVMGLA